MLPRRDTLALLAPHDVTALARLSRRTLAATRPPFRRRAAPDGPGEGAPRPGALGRASRGKAALRFLPARRPASVRRTSRANRDRAQEARERSGARCRGTRRLG